MLGWHDPTVSINVSCNSSFLTAVIKKIEYLFQGLSIIKEILNHYSLVRNALSFLAGRNGWSVVTLPTMVLAYAATLSSTLSFQKSVPLNSQRSGTSFGSSFLFSRENGSVVPSLVVCHAKKKLSFMEQILDYIEGGYF